MAAIEQTYQAFQPEPPNYGLIKLFLKILDAEMQTRSKQILPNLAINENYVVDV